MADGPTIKCKTAMLGLILATLVAPTAFAQEQAPPDTCKPLKQLGALKMKRVPDGRHLLPVAINKQPLYLMLDTGGLNALFKEAVDDLKLDTHRSNMSIMMVDGSRSDRIADLETLDLGQLRYDGGGIFRVMPGGNSNYPQTKWGGLLGAYLLRRFDIEIDFGTEEFNIFSQEHCPGRV